jgi:hypothetical protein
MSIYPSLSEYNIKKLVFKKNETYYQVLKNIVRGDLEREILSILDDGDCGSSMAFLGCSIKGWIEGNQCCIIQIYGLLFQI